jgi:hypothetical protein
LFMEMVRIIKEVHPKFVFLENVANITSMKNVLKAVVDNIASEGYDLQWVCLRACNVGSPMSRRRWFCLCKRMREPSVCSVEFPNSVSHNARVINGVYSSITIPKLKVKVINITLKKFDDDHKCKGKVVTKTLKKKFWSTPRTRMSYACRNLTKRGSFDLASQLRFATCTPDNQKHLKNPCIEWIEWLMGLPLGFTDLNCETPLEHNNWTFEPVKRLDVHSNEAVQRHFRLGNMCVPQMAKKAFDMLMEMYGEKRELD